MLKVTVLDKRDMKDCPYRNIIDRIGDKWSLLILAALEQQPTRFNELKRAIGDISQKVLSKTLKNLEADGYITRRVYDESPPKVVYALSEMGISALVPINQLVKWAEDHYTEICNNRKKYQGRKS